MEKRKRRHSILWYFFIGISPVPMVCDGGARQSTVIIDNGHGVILSSGTNLGKITRIKYSVKCGIIQPLFGEPDHVFGLHNSTSFVSGMKLFPKKTIDFISGWWYTGHNYKNTIIGKNDIKQRKIYISSYLWKEITYL